jgi:hypothetical protein
MNRLTTAYGNYVSTYHWQGFVTASYRFSVNLDYSQFAVREWMARLGPSAYALAAHEVGPLGGRVHLHALVGGIYDGRRDGKSVDMRELALVNARRVWGELDDRHGHVEAETFDARKGAASYVTKCAEDWEFLGAEPKRHCARNRRR